MLSAAIIIFREIFEVSLVLGILLAATRGLVSRAKWIWTGLAGGIAGSGIVAVFTKSISRAVGGMGQELFNAIVLFLAAILIGWTVVWMGRHGRELTQQIKEAGQAVIQGKKPLYTLAIVIALSVWREGSEIVLFMYGVIASGESIAQIIFGSALGLISGIAAGTLIYCGLIKIATKNIFSVTSWLLIFLAAGMASQAAGSLVAGDFVPTIFLPFVTPVWDTSAFISEHSWIGTILHTLIGYTERPSAIQLIVYLLTFGYISIILKFYGKAVPAMNNLKKTTIPAAGIIVFTFFLSVPEAWATKKVYSPYVEKDEVELEARGSINFDDRQDEDGIQKQKYALGYGVTDRWFTEVYGEVKKEYNDDSEDLDFSFTEVEWENKFQLTDKGQYPADLGFLLEYAISAEDKHADKLEWSVLLSKELGKTEHYANFKFEHEVGGGHADKTEGGFAWSSRYRLSKHFEPGFEYHADFGGLNDGRNFQEQNHQAGPVFYGALGDFHYDLGYLLGVSKTAFDGALKWILEYEHSF